MGLDHLDNLCKLMEELTALKDQNSRLQMRVQHLEDEKDVMTIKKDMSLSSVVSGGTWSQQNSPEIVAKEGNKKVQQANNKRLSLQVDEASGATLGSNLGSEESLAK